jgi:hypothetical protein
MDRGTIIGMKPPPGGDKGDEGGGLPQRFRTAANLLRGVTARHTAVTEALPQRRVTHKMLPERYQIREDDDGRFLSCLEASNIAVRVERGLTVSASAARKYPKGTIFLDGVAAGEPFMDAARGIYNLDHHEGCVRAFTLAACEQAMVLIRKGLDLDGDHWKVWANEPDLDTVLAVWLLLNHRRIDDNGSTVRQKIMPVVRLQGVIDAHGFELKELTGFPNELQESAQGIIDGLRGRELRLKQDSRWGEIDFLEFTMASLAEIDELVYTPLDFEDAHAIEELARERILPQRIAVACRSEAGIYEVEEQLRDLHDDRLGLLILEKEPGTYTLRQVDPFLPVGLDSLYQRLNLLDPAVDGDARWGGSGEIGGSPRRTGTGLDLSRIMAICRSVYQPPTPGRRLSAVVGAVAAATAAIGIAALAGGGRGGGWSLQGLMVEGGRAGFTISAVVLAVFGLGLLYLRNSRYPGYFGVRRPRRLKFLATVPISGAVALAGGAWLPLGDADLGARDVELLAVTLVAVIGVEALLRGVLHGDLVRFFPVMNGGGRRFISVPNLVAAVVYSAAVTTCLVPPTWLAGVVGPWWAAWAAAALILGLACGVVRERSASLWAAVVLHGATAIAGWAVFYWYY